MQHCLDFYPELILSPPLCSFKCGEDYHCPTSKLIVKIRLKISHNWDLKKKKSFCPGCDTIRKWLIKCHDDSETANYIAANTKDVSGYGKGSSPCMARHAPKWLCLLLGLDLPEKAMGWLPLRFGIGSRR